MSIFSVIKDTVIENKESIIKRVLIGLAAIVGLGIAGKVLITKASFDEEEHNDVNDDEEEDEEDTDE